MTAIDADPRFVAAAQVRAAALITTQAYGLLDTALRVEFESMDDADALTLQEEAELLAALLEPTCTTLGWGCHTTATGGGHDFASIYDGPVYSLIQLAEDSDREDLHFEVAFYNADSGVPVEGYCPVSGTLGNPQHEVHGFAELVALHQRMLWGGPYPPPALRWEYGGDSVAAELKEVGQLQILATTLVGALDAGFTSDKGLSPSTCGAHHTSAVALQRFLGVHRARLHFEERFLGGAGPAGGGDTLDALVAAALDVLQPNSGFAAQVYADMATVSWMGRGASGVRSATEKTLKEALGKVIETRRAEQTEPGS